MGQTTRSEGGFGLDVYRSYMDNVFNTPQPEPEQPGFARRALMGTLRTVAGSLEPLQLPKDILDAIAAGFMDPTTTIAERLNRLELRKYFPWGETPARPATGQEILGFMGADEDVARWGGIAWDLFADPLLAGAVIGGVGKLAGSAKLVKFGRDLDMAMTPLGVYRFARNHSSIVEKFSDDVADLFRAAVTARIPGSRIEGGKTFSDYFMARRSALEMQMPNIVPPKKGEPIEGVIFGRRFHEAEAIAEQTARDITNRMSSMQVELLNILRGPDQPFIKRVLERMGIAHRRGADVTEAFPQIIRDAFERKAYNIIENVPIGTRRTILANKASGFAINPELLSVVSQGRMTSAQRNLLTTHAKEIMTLAERHMPGVDPKWVADEFRRYVKIATEADALAGYYNSGLPFIQSHFFQQLTSRGVKADDIGAAWREIYERSVAGDMSILESETLLGKSVRSFSRGLKDPTGETITTIKGLLGPAADAFGLPLPAYLHNVVQAGHMRRAFGMFQDDSGIDAWIRTMETGKIFPSNILDEEAVKTALRAQLGDRVADMVGDYVDAITAVDLKTGTARSVIIRQPELVRHLKESGLSNTEAMDAMETILKTIYGEQSPMIDRIASLRKMVDDMSLEGEVRQRLIDTGLSADEATVAAQSIITKLKGSGVSSMEARMKQLNALIGDYDITTSIRPTTSGRRTSFAARNPQLADHVAMLFGEMGRPVASLAAQATDIRSRMPWSQLLTTIYPDAVKAKVASRFRQVDPISGATFRHVPKDPEVWGPFAGMWVHPRLRKELEVGMLARGEYRATLGQRLRSLITGGYIAAPNVIAVNVIGGMYTSWLGGTPPGELIPAMVRQFRAFGRASSDPTYIHDVLDDLRRYIDIDRTTLVGADIERLSRNLRDLGAATEDAVWRRAFNDTVTTIQNQLDAPLGIKWAGLDGFQFTENLMKVSVFDAQRRMLARAKGIDLAEFAKPVAQRSDAALQIERTAAEFARTAVFDYSELPEAFKILRDYGLLLFPGFPFFLAGRTLNAAITAPKRLALADRFSEAVANAAIPDENERLAAYAALPEWLIEEQGTPLPFMSYTAEDGSRRHSFIPFGQMVPTATFTGNPWGESLATVGIWKPFIEVFAANMVSGDGKAVFSSQYGQRVFEEGAPLMTRLAQSVGYLITNLAPGFLRKAIGTYNPRTGVANGIVSELVRNALPTPPGLDKTMYSFRELDQMKADRRMADYAIAALLRSPQVVTVGGPMSTVLPTIETSRQQMQAEVNRLNRKAERALLYGNERLAQRYLQDSADRSRLWVEEILPRLEAWRRAEQNRE